MSEAAHKLGEILKAVRRHARGLIQAIDEYEDTRREEELKQESQPSGQRK